MSQTEELLSFPGGTIHHLPPACRKPLADVLAEAMRRLREKRDAIGLAGRTLSPVGALPTR